MRPDAITTVIDLFCEQVEKAPLAIALETDAGALTYHELDRAADEIALRVQPYILRGQCVAIVGSPRAWFIASVLGVLKAGGVILLVDSRLPVAYQSKLFERAKPCLALFEGGVETAYEPPCPCLEVSGQVSEDNLVTPTTLKHPTADDSAYIFFTSGTTGTPKGILGWHGALAHFISWQIRQFEIGAGDRVALLTRLSFDVVLRDIFLPLCSGATLVLPENDLSLNFGQIADWLKAQRITALHLVPSLAACWVQYTKLSTRLQDLRIIFFAGEPLTGQLIEAWKRAFGEHTRFINLYGPTETTLAKFYYEVPDIPDVGNQPVGQCLPYTRAILLDEAMQPVAEGEKGEVYIATPFASRGYIHLPEETEKRFITLTLPGNKRVSCYRTGDQGVVRSGLLMLTGRMDDQVKINGVRIELNEISSTLNAAPNAERCVVLVNSSGNASSLENVKALICFYKGTIEAMELRIYAQKHLPISHVPRHFYRVDDFPLVANGKLDKKALLEEALSVGAA